ncbi:MAG TPA: SelD-related putative sulfur metabolism protein [Nitrososphaeraceae archaeon]|nr:SelD-related putative sulfur metabolism protein [Nitrososphaeraceae archaeon]
MSENFWKNIEEYRRLGFDPLRWIPTCSNQVDDEILQASLNEIKRSTIKLEPTWFDSFYYMDGKNPELTRRLYYNLDNPDVEKEAEIKRALLMFRIHTEIGNDSVFLSEMIRKFLKSFRFKVISKKVVMSLTVNRESQFALLDYIRLSRGDKVGYTSANNSTTQITDPTLSPESEIHSDIALTMAMENLNLLGCTSGFRVFPIYDAPTENLLDTIRKNLDAFTSRHNLAMDDYSSVRVGSLFFGSTAVANTLKEQPIRYEQVEEGMQIVIPSKLGTIPAISIYILAQMDEENISKIEDNDISLDFLTTAKDEVLKSLSEPRFSLGKVISRYCPDFGTQYDKHSHITAVYPIMTDGILAVAKFARLVSAQIIINNLPMKYDEIARFAAKELLVENATAASTGCHMIVATENVANLIMEDLRKHNFEPSVIGFVAKKNTPGLKIEADIDRYVSSKAKLTKLNLPT